MIVVKVIGGLGNQLFQYACGKSLGAIELDISGFDNYKLHKFLLPEFGMDLKYGSPKDWSEWYREPYFEYREIPVKDNIYLEGYWQSEKYFKDIREELLDELVPEKYILKNTVSLHLRRKDYVLNCKHGVLPIRYYNKALRQFKGMDILIFSDDIEWAKSKFDAEFVEGGSAVDDMKLMSHCEHNIIANSTFSWWGAWLNRNPNKKVIAPKKWFNESKLNTKDLIPETWIKL